MNGNDSLSFKSASLGGETRVGGVWKADRFILGASRVEADGFIFMLRTSFISMAWPYQSKKGAEKKM